MTHAPPTRKATDSHGAGEPRIVIVGAGTAGLCAAAALVERGFQPVVLEAGPHVGTAWRGRHAELRLNTIRWLSKLPGAPMPRDLGRWVRRDDLVAHLEAFAVQRRLDVRCGVRVERIERANRGWRVVTQGQVREADHVVVATGGEHVPHVPDWPGRDERSPAVQHVARLGTAAALTGKHVLLVGAGNSGVEIAGHLIDAQVASLALSMRTPPTIVPRELWGLPLHPLSLGLRLLPERLRDALLAHLSWLAFGSLKRFGLPRPREGAYRRLRTQGVSPAVDDGFVRHLKQGRIEVRPEVERFEGDAVVFADGRRLRPDVVLAATGFRTGLPSLVGGLPVLTREGRPRVCPVGETPGAPGLWFVGYRNAIEGNIRQHPAEGRRVARLIARTAGG